MPARKRNEWLDDEAEEGESGADVSEDESKRSKTQLASRSIKRRKLDEESDSNDEFSSDEDALDKSAQFKGKPTARVQNEDTRFAKFTEDDDDDDDQEIEKPDQNDDLDEPASASAAKSAKKTKSKKKSGVIYISRIPPFMKPATVRSYLSPFGEIGKLFLTPEDSGTYTRRVRSGGNKKHSYVDGWVEFLSKKDAKMVATVLNGNIIGGKKGNYYHDDIWNIKYLTGFKWDDLTEQIQRENKEREARLRTEITKAKKENEAFVRDIERGKMVEGIRAKRGDDEDEAKRRPDRDDQDRPRKFKQTIAMKNTRDELSSDDRAGQILSRII